MAITVDYTVTPFLITIPQADLTLESGTKYTLTVDEFWLLLREFTDNEGAMAHPKLYSRIPATSSTPSITEIEEAYYALQFEDGLYSVNITEGNTNIRDVEVKNQVSVNTNNTTGFIDPAFLEHGTFDGGVWVDVVSGIPGTAYPIGTPGTPVNNYADALTIMGGEGLSTVFVVSTSTVTGLTFPIGTKFIGVGASGTVAAVSLHLVSADIYGCEFEALELNGKLNGANTVRRCRLSNIDIVSALIVDSTLRGVINMRDADNTITILDCWSGIAGGGAGQYPSVDMIGANCSLVVRGFSGGFGLSSFSGGTGDVSMDFESGRLTVESTVTAGDVYVRGICDVVDNSTGTATVHDQTISQKVKEMWKRLDLDQSAPNTHWKDSSRITNSADIDLVSTDNGATFTVQRQ